MFKDDLRHYCLRAEDARMLAKNAASDALRGIHLELARNYELLADDARTAIENSLAAQS